MLLIFAIYMDYGRVKVINENIENILNRQINKEFYSAYLYLAMSAYFEELGLKGFANWTKVQAREEVDHGMILFDYIVERNGKVKFTQVEAPDTQFENPLQIFEKAYAHEKSVTEGIDCIANTAYEECDLATRNFINWYIAEQVEEEANTRDVVQKLQLFGDNKCALYHIDEDLSKREYKQHSYKL